MAATGEQSMILSDVIQDNATYIKRFMHWNNIYYNEYIKDMNLAEKLIIQPG